MLIVADANNLFNGCRKKLCCLPDYRHLVSSIEAHTGFEVAKKIIYVQINNPPSENFEQMLKRWGWEVRKKPGRQVRDAFITNYNVEILCDIMSWHGSATVVMSADRDLLPGLKYLASSNGHIRRLVYAAGVPKEVRGLMETIEIGSI